MNLGLVGPPRGTANRGWTPLQDGRESLAVYFPACDGGFPNSVAKHPGTIALIRGAGIVLVTLSLLLLAAKRRAGEPVYPLKVSENW